MRVSIGVTNYSWPSGSQGLGPELARLVRAADQTGVDTVWVVDHLLQADPNAAPGDTEMLEAYTTLGFLAGQTERVRLGTMVTGATFRLPVVAERFERLEETLQIAARMWAGDDAPFQGRHYRLQRPTGSPLPVQRPHPPVLIGGAGEHKTLRLVAQYADACNLFDIPDGGRTVKHKLEVLARHCEDAGRPYDAIEKTLSTRLGAGESADAFISRCAAAAALGIEHMVVSIAGQWTADALATLAAAIPTLREGFPSRALEDRNS